MHTKRFVRSIACFVCALLLIPLLHITAFAVTVTGVPGVEVTVDSNGSISESNGTVTVTVKGSFTSTKTSTITVTNTSGSTATISFDASLKNESSSTLKNGNNFVLLTAGGTETYTMTSTSWTLNTTATATLSNFKVEAAAAESNVTVTYGSLGSVKIDGTAVASGSVNPVNSTSGASFVATPGSGNKFLAWIDPATNAVISTSATYQLIPTKDMAIKAVFTNASSVPMFFADGQAKLFESFDTAISHASSASNKTITLASDGTFPAGNYTIPAGVILLIPYDAANTLCTTKPTQHENAYTKPSVYRKLTMQSGANITVNGALSISGSQSSKKDYNGMPSGPLGFIDMNSGSKITVNGSASLYVWGYITGSGSVEVKSSGTVYECFQIADYRGGDATSSIVGKDDDYGVFPFNQFYVQNVEVPMTLHAGATEHGFCSLYVSYVGVQDAKVPFIGTENSMFVINSGHIVKDYVEGTGRTDIKIYGDLSISSITISAKVGFLGSITIASSKYALPIPHHFTVSAESGSITMNQSMAFLPGSELYIKEGTTCTLGSGNKIYFYDLDEWLYNNGANGYSGTSNLPYIKLKYVPGGDGITGRSKDALAQIDGTVDVSAGSAYVTSSGANLYSTGTGVVTVKSATDTKTSQVITNGSSISSWPEIAIQPALLNDEDGTDVATTAAGEYKYYAATGKWCPPGHRYESIVTPPTCTEKGYTTHTCIACGSSYTDTEVAAPGHTEVIDAAVAPTCTETGLTEGKHCSVCGEVLVAQEKVAANGHSFSTDTGKCGVCDEDMRVVACWIGKNTITYYQTLAAAVAAYNAGGDDGYIQMQNDTNESSITATRDLYLNLNGKDVTVTGTFEMGEHVLYGMDSATDGLTDSDYGVISGTVSGTVETVHNSEQGPNVGRLYVSYTDNAGLSFHRIRFGINSCTYYQKADGTILDALTISAIYKGDTQALEKMSDFGMAVSVADTPINSGYEWDGAESEVFETVDGNVTDRLLAYLLQGYATGVLGQEIGAEALLKIGDIQISADVVTIDMANIGTQGGA